MNKKIILNICIGLICFFTLGSKCFAKDNTFISLAPSITEIIYALGAESNLLAVSTECDFPQKARNKEKIGNSFFFDNEKLLKLSPDYLLTVDGIQLVNTKILKKRKIKMISYTMDSVNSVYSTILSIGELSGKKDEAVKLVKTLSCQIDNSKPQKQKNILYLIQLNPIITVGNKSYISDVIRKSGHKNVSDDLNSFYPVVSNEYILNLNPDIVIINNEIGYEKIKTLFPNSKFIFLTKEQNSLINRPGPRIYKAVKFLENL